MPARIMIVDDDRSLLSAYGRLLASAGFQVEVADSGNEAIELGSRFEPDVALLDIGLPDMRGLQVRERLNARHPRCKFVFMTGNGRIEDAIAALRNGGALDFLLKPIDPDALVRVVSEASNPVEPAAPSPTSCPLTDRELEVLQLLAKGKDTVGVAKALCISLLTVKNHLRNIFARLGVNERTHAVAIAIRAGWV